MAHQVTVMLPDEVYKELRRWARERKKSVREIVEEVLCSMAGLRVALLSSLKAKLSAFAEKSDEELWRIAKSPLPASKQRRLKRLVRKHESGETLTEKEREEWMRLVEEAMLLSTIRSEAYAILKRRGHKIPTPEGRHWGWG